MASACSIPLVGHGFDAQDLGSLMSSASAANLLSADAELSDISFASDSSVVFFAAICGGVYHAGRVVHVS
jgi:hypothetical protein